MPFSTSASTPSSADSEPSRLTCSPTSEDKSIWQKSSDYSEGLANGANVGIVLQMISRFWMGLLTIAGGIFAGIIFFTDPLIYLFKAINRLCRLVGRSLGVKNLQDESLGSHPLQTYADIACLILFGLTIGLFFLGPVGITLAWITGLIGLVIVGKFDYVHQESLAEKNYNDLLAKHEENLESARRDGRALSPQELQAFDVECGAAYAQFEERKKARKFYVALVVGLFFLLVLGSAAVFAPPAVVPILIIAGKIGAAYLGVVNACRFGNWLRSKPYVPPEPLPEADKDLKDPNLEAKVSPAQSSQKPRSTPTFTLIRTSLYVNRDLKLDAEETKKVIETYQHYKNSKPFQSLYRYFFTSQSSLKLISDLKALEKKDIGKDEKQAVDEDRLNTVEIKRAKLIEKYLNNEKNSGTKLYELFNTYIQDINPAEERRGPRCSV